MITKQLLLFVIMTFLGQYCYGADTFSDAEKKKLIEAIKHVETQSQQMAADKKLHTAQQKSTQGGNKELLNRMRKNAEILEANYVENYSVLSKEELKKSLTEIVEKSFGKDVVEQIIAQQYLPEQQAEMDAHGERTFKSDAQGVMWAFWATDAPGVVHIPNQLALLSKAYPHMNVYDCHIMRLSDWKAMAQTLSQLKDLLEQNDPAINDEIEAKQKLELRDRFLEPYYAATEMATTRRVGGYKIFEDVQPALNLHVQNLPTFVYISKRGIVHRIKGVNRERHLSAWVTQCLKWEKENDKVLKERESRL